MKSGVRRTGDVLRGGDLCRVSRCVVVRMWRRCKDTRFFFFNDTATTEIYTLSLHDALPIFNLQWYEKFSSNFFVAYS